jgi:hypothetical protein
MPEITQSSISRGWLKAIQLANSRPRKEVSNLIVNIQGLTDTTDHLEDRAIRSKLDRALEENDNFSISTVANTIFPASLWKPNLSRKNLYDRYLRLWPRISKVRQNRRGTYFQRLIGYPEPSDSAFNQLEFIISAYSNGTRRRSALQGGILAPHIDLNATPFQGFPCMQQVAFIPEGRSGLRISAVYPMHYLWARAYGNYLGLIHLGRFMAAEMGLELTALTCIALVAKVDEPELIVPFLEAADAI